MKSQPVEDQGTRLDLSVYMDLFLDEASTFLAMLRKNLSGLIEDPADPEALSEAHRAAHTLKGMSSTMRYEELAALAESLEGLLQSEAPLPPADIAVLQAGYNEFEVVLERLKGSERPNK
jgi:two-component system chemotaxis sensor kinase CheA